MAAEINTVQEYLAELPTDRKEAIDKLRSTISSKLSTDVEEQINYGMIGYVIPHSVYPSGYHVKPELPLPFVHIASQKNFVALYHMGLYANPEILQWFIDEYPKHSKRKLDMGKSCIRFKNMDDIPYELIGELCSKMTAQDWISLYEKIIKKQS